MKEQIQVHRIQTGMRIEKRILKVLKALAEYLDMTLGDLIEGIVLHVFEGKAPFDDKFLKKIEEIKGFMNWIWIIHTVISSLRKNPSKGFFLSLPTEGK